MMTPASFQKWLADMRAAGRAKSDGHCAKLLGVSDRALRSMKADGVTGATGQRTALACAALLYGLPPVE